MVLLAFALAAILSITDFFTEEIFKGKRKFRDRILSFSAGVAIAYLFIKLLPELYFDGSTVLIRTVFFFVLIGFITIFLIEKHLYKNRIKKKFRKEHRKFHLTFFFIYNFIIGMVLFFIALSGLRESLLFFIPFLLYMVVEIIPQEFKFRNEGTHLLYSAAPLAGTLTAFLLNPVERVYMILLGLITGALFYLIVRESIPPEKRGKPAFFMLGVIFYTSFVIMTWFA